jgi:hypothetical protein
MQGITYLRGAFCNPDADRGPFWSSGFPAVCGPGCCICRFCWANTDVNAEYRYISFTADLHGTHRLVRRGAELFAGGGVNLGNQLDVALLVKIS